MTFLFSLQFRKEFKKLPAKVRARVEERLELLENEEFHPTLNNHKLHGEYAQYRSIAVSGDMRIVYRKVAPDACFLVAIGSHTKLYD